MRPFSYLHAQGLVVLCFKCSATRVWSNLGVKLEIAEGKVSEMKQTGLWNKSICCCSRNRGKPENKCARKPAEKLHGL